MSRPVKRGRRRVGSFQIEGLKELEQGLSELSKATARRVMIRALTRIAQPMADAMSARAPIDTGALSASIVISARTVAVAGAKAYAAAMKAGADKAGAAKAARAANKGARGKDSFAQVFVGPSQDGFYGRMLEFGTEKMAARPWARPAFDESKDAALAAMRDTLADEIDKAAARARRRAARLAAKAAGR